MVNFYVLEVDGSEDYLDKLVHTSFMKSIGIDCEIIFSPAKYLGLIAKKNDYIGIIFTKDGNNLNGLETSSYRIIEIKKSCDQLILEKISPVDVYKLEENEDITMNYFTDGIETKPSTEISLENPDSFQHTSQNSLRSGVEESEQSKVHEKKNVVKFISRSIKNRRENKIVLKRPKSQSECIDFISKYINNYDDQFIVKFDGAEQLVFDGATKFGEWVLENKDSIVKIEFVKIKIIKQKKDGRSSDN